MAAIKKMMGKEEARKPGQHTEQRPGGSGGGGGKVFFTGATPARIEELIARTGARGEAMQIRCKVLDGRDRDKVMRRNVKGPVRVGDILMLRETEFEAKPLDRKGRGMN